MNQTAAFRRFSLAALLVACCCGCGPGLDDGISISGKVTYNGEPLKGGSVYYHPVADKGGKPAVGTIQPDGSFRLNTSTEISGVVPGEYQISVTSREGEVALSHPKDARPPSGTERKGGPDSAIPVKYNSPKTSGLTDTVTKDHSGTKDIELKD